MVAKSSRMSLDLRALAGQLEEQRRERARESTSRKTTLSKLREELKDLKETAIHEAKILEKETTSREAFDLANFTESENAKNEELLLLQKNLEDKGALNKKKEIMLRKKKARVEKELENWIMKYDQEMEEKESELTSLKQEYDLELKELKETEEAYEKVMKEKETFAAEHKRKEALAKREKSKKKRLDAAALVIQRTWKKYTISKKKASMTAPSTKQLRSKSPSKSSKSPGKGSLRNSPSKPVSNATAKPKPKLKETKEVKDANKGSKSSTSAPAKDVAKKPAPSKK